MMLKKRGFLVVLVLVILFSFSGWAEPPLNAYESVWMVSNYNTDGECGEADATPQIKLMRIDNSELVTKVDDTTWQEEFEAEKGSGAEGLYSSTDSTSFTSHTVPADEGCWMHGFDEAGYNEYAWAKILPGTALNRGTIVNSWADYASVLAWEGTVLSAKKIMEEEQMSVEGTVAIGTAIGTILSGVGNVFGAIVGLLGALFDNTDDSLCMLATYNFESYQAMVCADDHYWHECLSETINENWPENLGAVVWGDKVLYQCALDDNNLPRWLKLDSDLDGDGYTAKEDCRDDPSQDYLLGKGVECPYFSPEETSGKILGELREMVRAECEQKPGEYSGCAICINSGAAEVCGDSINNDCGGPGAKELADDLVGITPDSCDLNQASCEQQFVGHCSESNTVCSDSIPCDEGEECKMPTDTKETEGVCKYIGTELEETPEGGEEKKPKKEGNPCTDTVKDCGDPDAWLCYKASASAKNIYDTEFSWIDTAEGGYCCGFRGAGDAGEIIENLDKESYLCLTKKKDIDNKNFVSTEKDFEGIGIDEIFENSGCKGKSWCWVPAAAANNLFKIFTINRPGEMPFDIVSNADDWLTCDASSEKTFEPPALPEQEVELSNRFYCYKEGSRWAWAECTDDWTKRENPSVKGRYTGEGLYTLPLPIPEPEVPENPDQKKEVLREDKIGKTITVTYDSIYKKYYGKGFLDFTGYDYLNFMVRFVKDEEGNPAELKELKLPLKIILKLVGPKEEKESIIYFEGNVLGYALNPQLSDLSEYMHIQVPISDYKAVQGFTISSGDNLIQVRNIYLTSDNESMPNQLCSGQESAVSNAWIKDADAGNPDTGITGENLCELLYGEEAWLGEDQEVSESEPAANCCGNARNEYYAGLSKGFVDPDQGSEAAYYGCWNSQPIASGEAVMDIEFQIKSQENHSQPAYSAVPLPEINIQYRVYEGDPEEGKKTPAPPVEGILKCNEGADSILEVGETSTTLCNFTLSKDFKLPHQSPPEKKDAKSDVLEQSSEHRGITKLWFKDPLSDDQDPVELLFYDLATDEQIGKEVSSATDPDDEAFKAAGPVQFINKEEALKIWNHPIAVVAKLKPKRFFPINNPSPSTQVITQKVAYSCSKTECLFPLPGNPPYKVTNLHPDLYELYYVKGKLASDEILITKADQEFTEYANLKAKRIAQQVLYYNEGEESTKDIGFYGCRAADFIENNPLVSNYFENMQYCAVMGDKFCSYSEVHEEENNKDAFTIVNTWSDDGLTHVGYADPLQKPEEGQNISSYYENVELVLKEQTKAGSTRNQSASIVPARNFIPNAEFSTSATKIPYWEVLVDGQAVADEKSSFAKGNKITLAANHKLRSERISIPASTDLYFNTAQECAAKILLVDKDGNSQPASLPQFNTGDASYLIVEFTGPCEVEKPMLQTVDEKGPVDYPVNPSPPLPAEFKNPTARSGAACCPSSYCWNGYTCVEPMGTLTTVTEHIEDGRDYRCIGGQWKLSPLKFDWNNQQWGFCPQENECFVLGSGKQENTAQSFYNGEYPVCINNNEYIFDNYCNQGNWTSRTKFLATKLLEVAENDEYVLYCSPYRETLLDLGNNENYLGGEFLVTQKQSQTLSQSLQKPAQPQALPTCFSNIKDPQGKRLVPDSQNTCINNVCVLQYKDGGEFKVALATTLNKEIDDPKSFLVSLNIPQDQLSQVCQSSGSDFIECNLQGLEFPSTADLYHSDELNAIIFARDGIDLEPGVVDKVKKWFKNFFGKGLLKEKAFITEAQNFRNIYLANVDGKKVRAMKEIFPGVKQTLVAEYQNFDTPVCEYVKNIKVPPELETELLEKATGVEKVYCAIDGTTQKVVVNAGLDFFWPQLTGKLRIGE